MSNHDESTGPEGYDQPAVEAWIADHVPQLRPPLQWTRLEGGHSNLTYRLQDRNGKQAVIRRPPQGELLPGAHDMNREWSLIAALGPTPVPVPEALAFCEDESITGARFYLMGLVDGLPLYNRSETEARVPPTARGDLAWSFVDVLADLHALEPDSIGLGRLSKKEDYVGRQLKTWYRSWNASREAGGFDDERAHSLHRFFLDNLPDQGPARVVHGDYGLHNCLIGSSGTVVAVVDWEISTLGDPLADLAYALNQWPEPGGTGIADTAPTTAPGFPARSAMAARYAARTGRDLGRLEYYSGFNHWKTAAIVQGVYSRYLSGQKSSEGVDVDHLRERVGLALSLAEAAVARL